MRMTEAGDDARLEESAAVVGRSTSALSAADSAVLAGGPRFSLGQLGALIRWVELGMALLALAAGSYIFVSTVRMIVQCWTAVPYADQWDELILGADKFFNGGTARVETARWVFSQHNEHRIAIPRLIFAADRFLSGMDNRFNLFVMLASQATLAALMILIALRATGRRISETIWVAAVVSALLFSAMQWENLLWGFQVQFIGVDLAALVTFAVLMQGSPGTARLATVIILESVAAYTLSSGMAVPFLTVPLALWARWPRRHVALLGFAAVALLAAYLHGYQTPSHHNDPIRTMWQADQVLAYVLDEIGNPFAVIFVEAHLRDPKNWGRLCGIVGVLLFAAFAADMLRRRERRGPVPILIATALFVLSMALLTALGRLKFGVPLSSRYSSPVLLFWAALIVVTMIRIRGSDVRLRVATMGATLPLLLGLAYYQPSFAALGRAQTLLPRLEGTTALLANVNDPEALVHLYPAPAIPRERTPLLRERHLSIFAEEWSDWVGTPLADHARLIEPAKCQGGIDGIAAVGTPDPTGWRANGWARDAERRAIPPPVVIADASGRVVGYGLSGFPNANGGQRGGWRGHFAAPPPVSVIAYALLDDGRTACPLGRWPASP
jgi:hypothetical protein